MRWRSGTHDMIFSKIRNHHVCYHFQRLIATTSRRLTTKSSRSQHRKRSTRSTTTEAMAQTTSPRIVMLWDIEPVSVSTLTICSSWSSGIWHSDAAVVHTDWCVPMRMLLLIHVLVYCDCFCSYRTCFCGLCFFLIYILLYCDCFYCVTNTMTWSHTWLRNYVIIVHPLNAKGLLKNSIKPRIPYQKHRAINRIRSLVSIDRIRSLTPFVILVRASKTTHPGWYQNHIYYCKLSKTAHHVKNTLCIVYLVVWRFYGLISATNAVPFISKKQ